jgi:predicted enzyme related to lactoylglutathione lyase
MSAHNPAVWFEVYVHDLARARRFYETVFQRRLEPLPAPGGGEIDMLAFPADMGLPGAGGALVRMAGIAPGMGGTLVYFGCEDCAVELSRVEAAGGRIHTPKFSIGPHGFCALVVDSEGNLIGLHSLR